MQTAHNLIYDKIEAETDNNDKWVNEQNRLISET
jgi:hypothetical protein